MFLSVCFIFNLNYLWHLLVHVSYGHPGFAFNASRIIQLALKLAVLVQVKVAEEEGKSFVALKIVCVRVHRWGFLHHISV